MTAQETLTDQQDMQTAFQTLTMADGTLAIKHVGEPAVTPPSAMSPLRNLSRPLQSTASSVINSEEDLSDFIIEDNYLEDSWGLHSSVLTGTLSHPEKSISNTSNLPEITSDQLTFANSSVLLQNDSRMYRICWVSDSELESISIDRDFSDFSLNRFPSVIDSTILGYGTDDASNCSILNESSYFDETDLSMNEISFPSGFFESSQEIH